MASDDFFDSGSSKKRANWVLIAFGGITLLVLALPLIWAFTSWL